MENLSTSLLFDEEIEQDVEEEELFTEIQEAIADISNGSDLVINAPTDSHANAILELENLDVEFVHEEQGAEYDLTLKRLRLDIYEDELAVRRTGGKETQRRVVEEYQKWCKDQGEGSDQLTKSSLVDTINQ
ncbi:hypothetical protein ROZALSC1DRAFT_27118 [Rozella allomycis CSF55]|uniref:Uncharacterized protein n=1 Tax=Rozella allomycis (strain CSF55) TaxID=988480 RepID=A0A075AQS5_ROZAC|nr:hypothetical protein O9G_006088 [Rozella allomycis CSF55]RKP21476.1 hypothetical protein ROZALSC1DRAFT_27118 [Rozella allomycis CSF55]|eukprot:EPZ32596.1 hypothetical protein O9G_006088 [Rozella allomycis CSF55]